MYIDMGERIAGEQGESSLIMQSDQFPRSHFIICFNEFMFMGINIFAVIT